MKYFLDTEFIEGFHKPLFGKRRHFIDLISIGIVAEDGREYYAISSEYDYHKADNWVKDNVIHKLYCQTIHGDNRNRFDADKFHKSYGKTNKQIAQEIFNFCITPAKLNKNGSVTITINDNPDFYAYYADYDWVVFCSLFGRMIDLPKGYPMYCKDLKQTLDEKSKYWIGKSTLERTKRMGVDITKDIIDLKLHPNYPKQENEHSAIDDAKWNMELFNFLNKI